jgi:hypothetical protein
MRSVRTAVMVLLCCAPMTATAQAAESVEDIYVARSLRLSRTPPTAYCAYERTEFENATIEDHYNFQSVSIRVSYGVITNANVSTIGTLHACFGPTADPSTSNFFAEGALGSVSFTGRGECRMAKKDFPEPGLNVFRCFLDIRNLPGDYVGGQLTTNTVTSRKSIGEISDPQGYVQPSIATVRLWKQRK